MKEDKIVYSIDSVSLWCCNELSLLWEKHSSLLEWFADEMLHFLFHLPQLTRNFLPVQVPVKQNVA